MHYSNVMPRRKLFSDWLNIHVTEQGVSLDPLVAIQGIGSKDLILIRLLRINILTS